MTSLPHIIATIEKNQREQVRVALDQYRETKLCDVRVFAEFGVTNTPTPTKKGLSVRVDLLPVLIEALTKAQAEAVKMGWLEGRA